MDNELLLFDRLEVIKTTIQTSVRRVRKGEKMTDICYIPKDCYVFDVKIKAGDTDKVHTVGYKLPSLIQELWFTKETPKELVKHEITYRVNRMIDTLYEELEKEKK